VCGAGIAGISAAIELARLGRKVVLADGHSWLGGKAVNSNIGVFAGLFGNPPENKQLTHGIADDILHDLGKSGDLHIVEESVPLTARYNEMALARWAERKILESGVTPLFGAVLRKVRMIGRKVDAVEFATRQDETVVRAAGFVDATGDAALVWQAGLECQEPAGASTYGSQMMVIEDFHDQAKPSRAELSDRLKERAAKYGMTQHDGLAVSFHGGRTAVVSMTHAETPLDAFIASKRGLEGRDQADRMLRFLREEFPAAFGTARVRAYGLPGIRQSRRIVGTHHLTVDEVRDGVKFEDSVARSAWPVEQPHSADAPAGEPFAPDHVHYVPLGSMTPKDVDNVIAAGRSIDADAAAISSVRVMAPSIAMGAAAAYALALAGFGSVHKIDRADLRQRVKANVDD
jgi:hypothetical protein